MAAFCWCRQVQAIAFDIQVAYDSIWKAGLLEKLVAEGLRRSLVSWIQSFLSEPHSILEAGASRVQVAPACAVV